MSTDDLRIIDAHIHLWDLAKLRYGWLTDGYIDDLLAVPYKPICRDYLIEEYVAEVKQSNVVAAVHIQAALDHPDPVDETKWLQESADNADFPMSIIGAADLLSSTLENDLDRHAEFSRFCGVRMLRVDENMFQDSNFRHGLKSIGDRGLVFDLDVHWESMDAAAKLAIDFPDIQFVLNHAGFPIERTPEYYDNWKRGMSRLAEPSNVVCKISGLGMYDPDWTTETIKPWFDHALDCFGVSRCMLASNWPLDSLFSTYDDLISAYKALLTGYSSSERQAVAAENARNYYRVDMGSHSAGDQ